MTTTRRCFAGSEIFQLVRVPQQFFVAMQMDLFGLAKRTTHMLQTSMLTIRRLKTMYVR